MDWPGGNANEVMKMERRRFILSQLTLLSIYSAYMPKLKKPKIRNRYSIGEWYGRGFELLTPTERFELAKAECGLDQSVVTCPFQKAAKCSKDGGVCSLRQYQQIDDGTVTGIGPLITTCPQRFLESDTIFSWVGEILLQTKEPVVLSEIGFLDKLRTGETAENDNEVSGDFIGRIDNVLVHPSNQPLEWCALELQAVYFSGNSMENEFKMLAQAQTENFQFPAKHRRPDWRSSGPKRLLPQLQTKVPTIRTWGKKMAVVIDEAFFASLIGLDRERHLSNAEIVWFVVGYDSESKGWKLVKREVVFTKLDASVKALTGGVPLSKEKFEEQLRMKLAKTAPSHPLAAGK